jgi:hypothetical protein
MKTTLYLENDNLRSLKKMALQFPKTNLTYHINMAIQRYISEMEEKVYARSRWAKIGKSVKRNYFGDAVTLQRNLRKEWD